MIPGGNQSCPAGGPPGRRRRRRSPGPPRRAAFRQAAFGHLLQDPQVGLDDAGGRASTEAHEAGRPAPGRGQLGRGRDPGPTGHLVERPAPLEADPVAHQDHPEAGRRAGLEALEPDVGGQQAQPAGGPSGSHRQPASWAPAAPGGAPERARPGLPGRAGSARPGRAAPGCRSAARAHWVAGADERRASGQGASDAHPIRPDGRLGTGQAPIGCQTVFISRKAAIHSGRWAARSSVQSKSASLTPPAGGRSA